MSFIGRKGVFCVGECSLTVQSSQNCGQQQCRFRHGTHKSKRKSVQYEKIWMTENIRRDGRAW